VTTPTPTVPLARIGSDAAELLIPAPVPLTLVRENAPAIPRALWTPLVGSALVVVASFFTEPLLTDSLTGRVAAGAALRISPAYKALAPLCDTLDTISLFSQRQHAAFLITCLLAFVAWRVLRKRSPASLRRSVRREISAAAIALVALVAVYAVGAMVPRPIAKLAMSSRDDVVVDFHSHTRYSWDGRAALSPEQSRRWHHASGFDVAYVTDHSTFAGAEEAALDNPARAGDATVMLSGIEVRSRGNHLVVLGTDAADWRSYKAGDLQENIFERVSAARGAARPVVLFTLPGNLRPASTMSFDGIELSDAAPRGLSQSDAQSGTIGELARNKNASLIASSNNHGWASASPAWSVMHVPGWRSMTPAQLDIAIRSEILRGGPSAVRVIDRRIPGPVSFPSVALTVPDAAWRMLTTISWGERASWLGWIWAAYALAFAVRQIRRLDPRSAERSRDWRVAPALIS
jgi:hypothetical protein